MHKNYTTHSTWLGGVFTFLVGAWDHFSPDDLSKIAMVSGIVFTMISIYYMRKEHKLKEKIDALLIAKLKDDPS
ncbi:hypothetical protein COMNV_00598 [Commensalibacter sp. Nvir]|uniref:hypothetical protein n=1 Tax=Commensalibacter sp. Nvir TaxID=3069817 RepID=UPI002D316D84|nr:hypothetical protein COMNV_00455 [Commensalibacter sp. Nvir]CAK7192402.1 hypothetical protein COMNV_00598 [Commensalibacter sp. Nvir]